MKVKLDYGPADHPRGQGAVERYGGWLHDVLAELCKQWPERWDEYVDPALWVQRTTPDTALPGHPTAFKLLFGREPRTQLDAVSPEAESPPLHNMVEQQKQNLKEVQQLLTRRHQQREEAKLARNAEMVRQSVGIQAQVRDLMLVRESDSSLSSARVSAKPIHDLWTGPWEVHKIVIRGLSLQVRMRGRKIRERTVSAANVKKFHARPAYLHHSFGDEYAQLAWEVELGLPGTITTTPLLYTLTDRKVRLASGSSWSWEYKGLFHDGTESDWLSEEELLDTFTGLQSDVFRALWEFHHPLAKPRPTATLSRAERDPIARDEALRLIPRKTKVRKRFEDKQGKVREFEG